MKTKNFFRRVGGMLVASAFIFSACEDDIVTSELNLDNAYKGTLKIYLNADLNLQESGRERVPDGTVVVLTGDNNSLLSSASGSWTREVEAVEGVIEVDDVPVANDGSYIDLYFPEFFYDQVQPHNAPEPTIRKRYLQNHRSISVYVIPNQVTTLKVDYTAFNDYIVPEKEVSITVELELFTRKQSFNWRPGTSAVPLNGTVTLYRNWGLEEQFWSKEVSVTDGILETTVPANRDFAIEYKTTIMHGDYETMGDDNTPWETEEVIDYILHLNIHEFYENQSPSHYERSYLANSWTYNQWQ